MSVSANIRSWAAALVSYALLVHDNPATAQSSAREHARVSFTSVQQYVAGEAIPRQLALPDNLVVSAMYRPFLETMLRASPTFRRQCMRVAAEPLLTVHLNIVPPTHIIGARAVTRLSRGADGHLLAAIQLASSRDTEELIAHEFEHIIEQLDGIDLAARAALRNTGVRYVGNTENVFETTRAQRVGLKVASELGR